MTLIIKFSVCLLYVIISTNTQATASTKDKLIIRGSDNYAPFEYLNKDGEPEGFNVDITRKLMEYLGYEYDLQLYDWSRVTKEIQNKEIDIVIGMIYSSERSQTVRFTLPTCFMNRNIITHKKNSYNSIEDLKGKKVIVETGGWSHKYLSNYDSTITIIESKDVYNGLKLLSSGKYDAMLTSDLVATYAIKKLKLDNLRITETDIEPQDYSMAVNQNNDKLLYDINVGLRHLKLTGEYDQIYNKWFSIYEPKTIKKSLLIILYILLSIAILLVLFIWILRKQVAKATIMLNDSKREVGIAIDSGKISAWTYTIKSKTITVLHGMLIGGNHNNIEKIYSMIHPQDIESIKDGFIALSEGKKKSFDTSFRIREEETLPYLHLETKMIRVEANKEHPCRIIGTFKDITKNVNLRLQLEDFHIKSEFIIRSSDIILLEYDIASKIFSRINNNGYTSKRRIFTISQYLEMVHHEDMAIANDFIKAINIGKDQTVNSEFRMLSNSGKYDWYIIKALAYKYDEDGNITSYLGLRRNNTEWKNITNDLILLKEKADTSNKLKSAFIANMSHEIRTPLNAIIGFSELLSSAQDDDERNVYMDIIRSNNDLLLKLINDILDLSKIEAEHIDLYYSEFDLFPYLEEITISLKLKETEQVKLIAPTCHTNIMICSDKNRISQVITNFVSNAFKFTDKGSVSIDYKYENNGIRISVTDTGMGITIQDQDKIFERFEKMNQFIQGAGLGLPICKGIAEALQGEIGVISEYGVGSTFWLWIPVNKPSTDTHNNGDKKTDTTS